MRNSCDLIMPIILEGRVTRFRSLQESAQNGICLRRDRHHLARKRGYVKRTCSTNCREQAAIVLLVRKVDKVAGSEVGAEPRSEGAAVQTTVEEQTSLWKGIESLNIQPKDDVCALRITEADNIVNILANAVRQIGRRIPQHARGVANDLISYTRVGNRSTGHTGRESVPLNGNIEDSTSEEGFVSDQYAGKWKRAPRTTERIRGGGVDKDCI